MGRVVGVGAGAVGSGSGSSCMSSARKVRTVCAPLPSAVPSCAVRTLPESTATQYATPPLVSACAVAADIASEGMRNDHSV